MKLTEKQHRAVHTDQSAVLVSAAAGSGKTSVLSQRVARLVACGGDIRNMLVVTFTNAAAAEMRRRIAGELYRMAVREGDARLLMQSELVGAADVSTFHSFCARVVRENYNSADISPDFRILGDAERAALRNGTMRGLFDLLYERQDKDFLLLLRRHTTRANDAQLMQTVLRVYDVMMGKPDPYGWALVATEAEEGEYIAWLKREREQSLLAELEDAVALMRRAAQVSVEYDEAQCAKDEAVICEMEDVLHCAKAHGLVQARQMGCKIPALARQAHEAVKEQTKELRSEARKRLKAFYAEEEGFEQTVAGQLAHTRVDVRALMRVVALFDRLYGAKKREQNALDYEDLQHKALLVLKNNGAQYSEKYRHIFVDEYQDTNPVQEEVIKALTGDNCLFMVGDVKQSIYKFRLADPGIFRQKAQEYGAGRQNGELILMNDNFRSTQGVIHAVNFLMDRVMSERLGEVCYDEGEMLAGVRPGGEAKVLLCQVEQEEAGDDAEELEISADAAQADMIAQHILGVLEEAPGDGGGICPEDIVVLVRSRSGLTSELKRALGGRGIPYSLAMEESKDLPEIELFVNLLRVVENPFQDVPLLSVMRSFVGAMDERDFAEIRLLKNDRETPFYQAAMAYAADGAGGAAQKLIALLAKLDAWREKCSAMALGDFLRLLREEAGFDAWL
ncbi:UvrD-helicase domain-containing protein, partial [Christensenellaceae bacterium OttesenSCG-928-K19]|nr:UvrD-helicase domain-containing protein [Christensenellaceae bacterium OttesenSCG-928-K19]